jgi:glucose-6-phosphate 1-dehydrogenase
MPPADPVQYIRGQYDGYLGIDGVRPESTTETYAAFRLEIDNWRWSGVPFIIRTGKRMPATVTELRVVFSHRPTWACRHLSIGGRTPTNSSYGSTRRLAYAPI